MKFLAIEKDVTGVSEAEYLPHLKSEARRVWELYLEGVIREIYLRGDRQDAVIVMECDTEDAARDILKTLPLAKQGLIDFDIVPLVPYPGFSRLFV